MSKLTLQDLQTQNHWVYQVYVVKTLFEGSVYVYSEYGDDYDISSQKQFFKTLSKDDFDQYLIQINELLDGLIQNNGYCSFALYDRVWEVYKRIIDEDPAKPICLSIDDNVTDENKKQITNIVSEKLKQYLLKHEPSIFYHCLNLGGCALSALGTFGGMTSLGILCMASNPASAIMVLVFGVVFLALMAIAFYGECMRAYERYICLHSEDNQPTLTSPIPTAMHPEPSNLADFTTQSNNSVKTGEQESVQSNASNIHSFYATLQDNPSEASGVTLNL